MNYYLLNTTDVVISIVLQPTQRKKRHQGKQCISSGSVAQAQFFYDEKVVAAGFEFYYFQRLSNIQAQVLTNTIHQH